jgi:hypothetical protein
MTTYTTWMVDDVLNLCASVEDFCGQQSTSIYLDEINVTKSPNPCTIGYNTPGGCGRHINNIEVTFKLAKTLGTECSHGSPTIVYHTIGIVTTDSNGICGLGYQVTNQDRLDYDSSNGSYRLFATISNSDGQPTLTTNICTSDITVLQNPCTGVTCPQNDCTGLDLYTYSCNPATGICDRTLLESNSSQCATATDYIEYDFSFLPTSFLNLVSSSMTDISDALGDYLPFPSNIQYVRSEYINKKLRIYVIYTLPTLSGLSEFYTSPDKISDLLTNLSIVSLVELSLDSLARLSSGILIFAICQMLLSEALGVGTVVSIIIAAIGAVAVDWATHNISLDTSTPGETNIPPDQQIAAIREFANIVRNRCKLLHPGCGNTPPTCNTTDMKSYNKCIGALDIEQYINDGKQAGTLDQAKVDELIGKVNNTDTCLTSGTCTVAQAKTDIDNRSNDVNANSQQKQQDTTCATGSTYDSKTKKCVLVEKCVIRNPFGGCILSSDTAQGLLMFGGLIIGGYLIMSSESGGGGSTHHTVTIREQISQANENVPKQKENVPKQKENVPK